MPGRRTRWTAACLTVLAHGVSLALVATLMLGCSDENGGGLAGPPNPPMSLHVEDGEFEITATIVYNGCNSTTVFDGTYNIAFSDSGFVMGGWSGDWSATANSLEAHGESSQTQASTRDCVMTSWTTVDMTFTSNDAFYGNIIYRYRAVGICVCCTSCQSTWYITGTRVDN
jgi:hypothetical protein